MVEAADPMTPEDFDRHFNDCVNGTSAEYVEARESLIREATPEAIPEITARLQDRRSAGEAEAITAEILLGWLEQRPLFEQVDSIIRSAQEPPSDRWKSGSPTPANMAHRLSIMGPGIVPRLIEILTRLPGDPLATGRGAQVVLAALELLQDPRAGTSLIALVGDPSRGDDQRILALAALGGIARASMADDSRALELASRLLADSERSAVVRGAAALCLGRMGDPQVAGQLLAEAGPGREILLRRAAVQALGHLGGWSEATATALVELLRTEDDEAMGLMLVNAIASLRVPRSSTGGDVIRELQHVSEGHRSLAVRRAARDALGQLQS
jgi:HEAT repeat protein